LLMPKLQYRFRVTFINLGTSQPTTELTKQVMEFSRPHVEFAEIALPIYNSTVKVAGKYKWNNVTCKVRDDAGGNVSQLVGEQIQKQLDFMEQSSAAAGIDYKFTILYEVLDGGNGTNTPITLESWELYGCYLSDINYDASNYATSEPMTVTMTITYDNALQLPQGNQTNAAGIGAQITRTVGDVAT